MSLRQKSFIGIALLCLVLACLPLEQAFGGQLTQMLKVTLTVYALTRGLNAVISVAQGTEMSIEPMGVGLTLTPGEILDPLNDLIEQVSSVLLVASASIGIQKIILMLADHMLIQVLLVLLAMLALLLMILKPGAGWSGQIALKLLIVLTVLRLLVPVLALVSHQTQQWLQTERQEAVSVLQSAQASVDQLNQNHQQESGGWFDNLRERVDIGARLEQVKSRAEQGVEAAVYLLAEFLLIMVLLPLLFVWLALRIIASIRI
ncbi:hypothetical protein [Methylophaga sp.]|jgi:hypothetical protein|uniref:hypothetical protein n=1 Tax=Methylophaga sp. TaxID=2024840 RepID=UPI0014005E04|nr:hypothetical protein [Methylophaga sp.]MTI63924.1 hypothetical protein [Methylophaga sp.]